MENIIHNNDELMHWGIRGMRWGVRRYQNKDGSLTAAGRKRLKAESAELKSREEVLKRRKSNQAKFDRLAAKRKALEDAEKEMGDKEGLSKVKKGAKSSSDSDAPKKKSISEMSDKELRDAIERARMEDTYRQLRPEPVNAKKQFMNKFVNEALVPAAVEGGKGLIKDALTKLGEKAMGEKIDPNSYEALKKTFDKLKVKQDIDKIKNPDKYLSEEDKNKRQQREFADEDREVQRRSGYKSVQEEQAAKRTAREQQAKNEADEAARKANEAKSKQYYEEHEAPGTYSYRPSKNSSDTVEQGKSSVSKTVLSLPSSVSDIATSTRNAGQSRANALIESAAPYEVIDKDGNTIAGYWSETRGEADGTF